jgi:SAM-dependent methyltransferase
MQSQYHTNIPDIVPYLRGKVLDVGTGDGKRVKEFQGLGIDITGIDINLSQVDDEFVNYGDATNLIYEDNFFDTVLSVDVWEHVTEPLRAISEAFRVSSNLVISSITPVESSCFWEDPTHKVEWDRERWKREINEYGEIIEILEPFTLIARKR